MEEGPKTIGELFNLLDSRSSIEEAELAEAWVVMTRDLDYGLLSFLGPYDNVVEAMENASQHEEDLRRDTEEGNRGWHVAVYPMRKR